MTVYWVGSPKFTPGHPEPLIALVHHRMVGTLRGTDAAFTNPDSREASTNFGVGYGCGRERHPTTAHVHQYVRLGDQAWGNGNWDATGEWNDRYPTARINSRTVSIEHHDNGGRDRGNGKGVVPESVLVESIHLDAMLLRGNIEEMRGAGIRFRDGWESTLSRELRALPVDRHHIVDHHYISGRLKPSCWQPWADDPTGFPQARYLAALADPEIPDTSSGDAVRSFLVPEHRTLATVKDGAWLYADSSLAASPDNVSLSPSRELVYIGIFSAAVRIVAYEPRAGDVNSTSAAMFVRYDDILSMRTEPDATGFSRAQVDAAYNEGRDAAVNAAASVPRR